MVEYKKGVNVDLPIRLELLGADVTGKVAADLTVQIANSDSTDWELQTATTHYTLNELSTGDYTLTLLAVRNDTIGHLRFKIACTGADTKQYVVFVSENLVSDASALVWNTLTSALITVNSIGIKLANWVLGTDSKILISADAQDLSTTLDVNAKKLGGATPNNLAAGSAMDLVDALKNKSGSSGFDRTTDSLEGLGDKVSGLTAQQTRDAMALALTGGTSIIEDSVDDKLDDIPTTPLLTGDTRLPSSGVISIAGDKMNLIDAPNATAITAIQAGVAMATELAKVKGAIGGKCIISADGLTVQKYDFAGTLLVTLVRTGTGPYTWTPTWA